MSDLTRLTNDELGARFESACAFAAGMYSAKGDCTTADAEVDRIFAELQSRGIC